MDWDTQSRWRRYIEQKLNRLAAEIGGGAGAEAERITAIMDEIDALREELKAISERIQRHAEFLTELREERKDGENHDA